MAKITLKTAKRRTSVSRTEVRRAVAKAFRITAVSAAKKSARHTAKKAA